MTSTVPEDSELVRTITALLSTEGYLVSWLDVPSGARLILAENSFFVLGIGVTPTLDDLLELHPIATTSLLDRVREADAGAKQWDVYLVLLTPEVIPEDGDQFQRLASINYDTRGVRRIARAGIGADVESIQTAMRTFLPLPKGLSSDQLDDPLDQLRVELEARGVSHSDADRAVEVFRSTKSLQDV